MILLMGAFFVARILRQPSLYLTFCLLALVGIAIAGVRGRKAWLLVAIVSGLLSAQAVVAGFVE